MRSSQAKWTRGAKRTLDSNSIWFPLNLTLNICELLSPYIQICTALDVCTLRIFKQIEIIADLIQIPHFSPYIASLWSSPVKEFPSDSAGAPLYIQGKVWKEFLWNWKWTSFDQLGQTLVISQRVCQHPDKWFNILVIVQSLVQMMTHIMKKLLSPAG